MRILPVFPFGSLLVIALVACSSDGPASAPSSAGADGAPAPSATTTDTPDPIRPPDNNLEAGVHDPDAAATDGGGGLACGGLAYCDDFESYPAAAVANAAALGPWKASVSAGATMAIDGTKGFKGSQALHVTLTKASTSGAHGLLNQTNATGLIAGDNLFGRAMVFYDKTPPNALPVGVHSWLFMGWGNTERTNAAANVNLGGGGAAIQLNYHFASPPAQAGAEASKKGGTITAGAWHCLQWQYDGSGKPAADHAKAWLDGAVVVDMPKTTDPKTNWALPTWKSMDFGFLHYQALSNPVDVYLDEFAVDRAMIACPAK